MNLLRLAITWAILAGLSFAYQASDVHSSAPARQARQTRSDDSGKAKPGSPLYWRDLAETTAADLLSAAPKLDANNQIFLYGRLCTAYWKYDEDRARAWCAQSISAATRIPENETADERQNRVAIAGALLRILAPLDDAMRLQIQNSLAGSTSNSTSDDDLKRRRSLSVSLAEAARRSTPDQAAELISESMRLGTGASTIRAIADLRMQQPQRADAFFADVIQQARQSSGYNILWGLTQVVLPSNPGADTQALPLQWRDAVVATLAERMLQPTLSGVDLKARCDAMAGEVQRLIHSEQLPPATGAATQAALQVCWPQAPTSTQGSSNARPLRNADEFLQAAGNAKDPVASADLKMNAALRAEQENNPERGLSILDALTQEERNARPSFSTLTRLRLAVRAIELAFSRQQPKRAMDMLENSPEDTQLSICTQVAQQLLAKNLPGVQFVLDKARKAILNPQPENDPADYIKLVNVFVQMHSHDALPVATDALRALDAWKPIDETAFKPGDFYYQPLDHNLRPLAFVSGFFNLDHERLVSIGRSITSDSLRACFQLAILQESLVQYVDAMQKQAARPLQPRSGRQPISK